MLRDFSQKIKLFAKDLTDRDFDWWARYLTSIYVGGVFLLAGARAEELNKLPLNELGDFLAGAFGPAAFFWLVLGYRQQGIELKASSAALESQVLELKRSLDLQRAGAEKQDLVYDPVLEFKYLGIHEQNGAVEDRFVLFNRGDACRKILFKFTSKINRSKNFIDYYLPVLLTGENNVFTIPDIGEYESMGVDIFYLRANGSKGKVNYSFSKSPGMDPMAYTIPDLEELSDLYKDMV